MRKKLVQKSANDLFIAALNDLDKKCSEGMECACAALKRCREGKCYPPFKVLSEPIEEAANRVGLSPRSA